MQHALFFGTVLPLRVNLEPIRGLSGCVDVCSCACACACVRLSLSLSIFIVVSFCGITTNQSYGIHFQAQKCDLDVNWKNRNWISSSWKAGDWQIWDHNTYILCIQHHFVHFYIKCIHIVMTQVSRSNMFTFHVQCKTGLLSVNDLCVCVFNFILYGLVCVWMCVCLWSLNFAKKKYNFDLLNKNQLLSKLAIKHHWKCQEDNLRYLFEHSAYLYDGIE